MKTPPESEDPEGASRDDDFAPAPATTWWEWPQADFVQLYTLQYERIGISNDSIRSATGPLAQRLCAP
ncbi:hypothetical protein CHX26_07985 [Porphyrobacter sp. HT-58-2]|uniref:hypothetical protein n=1 Tax=Porphyrobacter sp. HT-58-2 TaxID=2023229 RepID=UPI000CDC1960|nr:hypothetical protein [Porphyrobacter sp. HT-58-2]AUX69439.1 hypothetical protein CHX26_07985 [Porphyrobacter sp. HT-58-2]